MSVADLSHVRRECVGVRVVGFEPTASRHSDARSHQAPHAQRVKTLGEDAGTGPDGRNSIEVATTSRQNRQGRGSAQPVYTPDQATAETLENASYLVPPVPPLPGCNQDPVPEKPTPAQRRDTQQNSPCDPHSNPLPAIYHPVLGQ